MSLLRLACVLTLAIWIGGLAVLGFVVAPTLFRAMDVHDPVGGHALAGFAFGAVFERFLRLSWGFATLMLALLGARAALGPRPRRFGIRMWTVTAMLAMALGTSFILVPRINHIRDTTPGTVASLPAGDPVKTQFGRLHAISNGIMLVTLLAGVGLLWIEMKDQ
jgi:hypothetical protein